MRWRSAWASTYARHPARCTPADDEQNEPGFQRKSIGSVSSVVGDLLATLTSTKDEDRSFVPFPESGGDSVILLVNNLGGLSELELAGVVKEAGFWLQQRKFSVKRVLSGTYMTSLNMPGVSLSVVLLPKPDDAVTKAGLKITEELLLELLDDPSSAPGWKQASKAEPAVDVFEAKKESKEKQAPSAGAEPGPKCPHPSLLLMERI